MKISLLQFYPLFKKPDENRRKATRMLDSYAEGDFDILLLPEMTFTGYCFESKTDIEPFVEDVHGPSIQWAKEQVVGFPEDKDGKYFNSQAMVSRKGSLLHVYQKHFLYETDENWAEEGDAFSSVKIEGLGQLGFGICMDVNPYQFKAPFSAFEFAAFHKERASKLLLLSMNWLTHENKPNVRDLNAVEQKPLDYPAEKESEDLAFEHLNYWCIRLSPLLKTNVKVAICNRTGREGNTAYVGSSCVIDMMQPAVLGNLNRTQECVLIVEI